MTVISAWCKYAACSSPGSLLGFDLVLEALNHVWNQEPCPIIFPWSTITLPYLFSFILYLEMYFNLGKREIEDVLAVEGNVNLPLPCTLTSVTHYCFTVIQWYLNQPESALLASYVYAYKKFDSSLAYLHRNRNTVRNEDTKNWTKTVSSRMIKNKCGEWWARDRQIWFSQGNTNYQ